MTAVTAAMAVLGFLELPEAEVPPELIWHHEGRLAEWWDEVKQRRANPGMSPLRDADMTENEMAEQYR